MSEFKDTIDKTEELARQIWLAGLGAYGQRLDNLQEGYDKMNGQTRKLFEELVARGEKLEADTKDAVSEANEKLKEQTEKLVKSKTFKLDNVDLNINERLAEIRDKISERVALPSISLPSLSNNAKLRELTEKVEELSATVARLGKSQKAPASRTPAKKAPTKKTSTTREQN